MPLDSGVVKRTAAEHGDAAAEGIKERLSKLERDLGEDRLRELRTLSKKIRDLDPQDCAHTYSIVLAWTRRVLGLKTSLQEQQRLSRAMRVDSRIQDDSKGESAQDRYRFAVDRLKVDVRFFCQTLQEFMDLPPDFSQQNRTWEDCMNDMEVDLKSISGSAAAENAAMSVDVLVSLLNYRDKAVHLMLCGLLFQKAVLDWDLKNERAYADGPMVSMAEQVVDLWSKHETLPNKYRVVDLPTASDVGPFTCSGKHKNKSSLPCSAGCHCFVTVLREMRSLDKSLRQMAFDTQVRASGETDTVGVLRDEYEKWFTKEAKLNEDMRKAKEVGKVENKVQKVQELADKDRRLKQQVNRVHKLEGDLQGLKHEMLSMRREKADLAERNLRIAKESVPILEQFKRVLGRSREAAEGLSADVELLSAMFQLQTKENKKILEEISEVEAEFKKVTSLLLGEQLKNKHKEQRLQKTETLYLRTMAARKSIHDSYLEQEAELRAAERRIQERDVDRQDLLQVLEGRDSEIVQLTEDLRRSRQRMAELQGQVGMCLQEYSERTGRPGADALAIFRGQWPPPAGVLDEETVQGRAGVKA